MQLPVLLGAAAVLVVGCLPDFVPVSELGEEPQVIVVRVSAPEAAPGDTVTFDALVHWPEVLGEPSLTWLVCVPDRSDDAETCVANRLEDPADVPLCVDEPLAQLCVASRDATASYGIPSVEVPEGEESLTLFVELVVGSGGGDSFDVCAEAVREVAPTEGCLLAVKRLEVSLSDAPNRNPLLTMLEVDGEPVDATSVVIASSGIGLEELRVRLAVSAVPASVDELEVGVGAGEEPPEWVRLPVAWYTTCGSFDDDAGGVRCDPPGAGDVEPTCEDVEALWSPSVSGECVVHVVLRDDRGGASYCTQRFEVQ